MSQTARIDSPPLTPVQRAATYEVLARCLAYPDEGSLQALGELVRIAESLLTSGPVARLGAILQSLAPGELETAHIGTFTAVTSPDCPTYESAFVCTDPGQQPVIMADVAGYYRAFGLELAAGAMRPDDVSVELSFLGYLCRKEAYALEHLGAPRVKQARRIQRLFLREHLGRWGEALGDRLVDSSAHEFYRDLGVALREWVAAEAAFTGAEPIDRTAAPQMPWPKPERAGGMDFGGPNGFVSLEDLAAGGEGDATFS